ncbi:MAG TPA: hypothetical protein PL070_18105 [Flavobacteriales bacterium]|nr:hypothetical protein [Flavobacteriales bacterium]
MHMANAGLDPKHFSIFLQEEPGNEKIVFKWQAGIHYTIHFGTRSGVIDLHRTREVPGKKPKYQTLLSIPHSAISAFAEALAPHLELLVQAFTPIKPKLGRLRHRDMYAQVMEPSALMKAGALRTRNKGRKLQVAKNYELVDPNDLYMRIDHWLPVGSYLLVQERKGARRTKGFLYVRGDEENKTFHYVPLKRMNGLQQIVNPALRSLLLSADSPMARKALAMITKGEARTMGMVISAQSGDKLVNAKLKLREASSSMSPENGNT